MSVRDYAGVARAPFLALPVTLVAVGAGAAAHAGRFDSTRALWALIGLTALHAAVNAFNEASDFRTGIDFHTKRTPFSGGSGTLPAGRLGYRAALGVGILGSLVGLAVGAWFLTIVGWILVPVIVLGAVAVLAYTDILARAYVGEAFAGLGLGFLPVLGTWIVQAETVDRLAVVAAVPAFFMTFNLLLLNEFPDESADRAGGRRNLVLLLGRRAAARVYALAALAVPAWLLAAVLFGELPSACLAAMLPSILLAAPFRWMAAGTSEAVPHPALAANVMWILATNLALGAALWLG